MRHTGDAVRKQSEERVGVVVCRDCCCGNRRRDPVTDHAAQLDRLRGMAVRRPRQVEVRVSGCLGPCGHANVVVVRPSPGGRRAGGRPVWLAFVRDLAVLEVLDDWLDAGGPGLAPIPDELDLHVFTPPRGTGRAD